MIDAPSQIALGLAMLSIGVAALGIREAIRQIIHRKAVNRRLQQIRELNQ